MDTTVSQCDIPWQMIVVYYRHLKGASYQASLKKASDINRGREVWSLTRTPMFRRWSRPASRIVLTAFTSSYSYIHRLDRILFLSNISRALVVPKAEVQGPYATSDPIILDDNIIMILLYCRNHLCTIVFSIVRWMFIFSSGFPCRSIPAVGVFHLTGSLLWLVILCISIRIGYVSHYIGTRADRFSIVFMFRAYLVLLAGQQDVVPARPLYQASIHHLPGGGHLLDSMDIERLLEACTTTIPRTWSYTSLIFLYWRVTLALESQNSDSSSHLFQERGGVCQPFAFNEAEFMCVAIAPAELAGLFIFNSI